MRSRRAFTLVELLIVVIIISVIATIAIPKFADSSFRAKEARLKLYLKTLRNATERFHADTGLWPVNIVSRGTPITGLNESGIVVPMPAGVYMGPYLDTNGDGVAVPGVALGYGVGGAYPVGSWRLISTATASDGTLYSSW